MDAAPLVPITIDSIYKIGGVQVPLPQRMAACTPDMKAALFGLKADVEAADGVFRLSDLFRSYDMQMQAHNDYVTGKKKAYSPAPGGSMHEAGRAFDVDLSALKMKLSRFWEIAAKRGIVPIIEAPNASASEAWHFECRGSFDLVRAYYAAKHATNMEPYRAMAASAIAAAGIKLDAFPNRNREVRIQSGLIRLGADPGNIDGTPGKRTRDALASLGILSPDPDVQLDAVEHRLAERFPGEWYDKSIASADLEHV